MKGVSLPDSSFFKTFVHQCNDLVIITDKEACIVYVNPAFEKHTGYKLKNITGKNISLIKSGLHNNTFYKNLWKKLKNAKASSTVFINKKKSGELYYESKTITPILDDKGKIQYFLSTSKDVTAEVSKTKFIENKLEESQKNAKIGTWEWDIKTEMANWSPEVYRIFELDPKKFQPTYSNFLECVHPDDHARVDQAFKKCLREKVPYDLEHRLITNSGKIKYVKEKGHVNYSRNGTVHGMSGTVQDITREKILKENLNSAYVSVQNSLNSIFTFDLNGNVLFANNYAVKMWGYKSMREMISKRAKLCSYFADRHTEEINNIKELTLKKGSFRSATEFSSSKNTAEEMKLTFHLSVIYDEYNLPHAITGAFFDVTEQIRNEKRIRSYDKRINLLLRNIDEVVFGVDAKHGSLTAGNVFYLSERSKDLMGFDLSDLQLKPNLWSSLIHPDDLEKVFQTNLKCISDKVTVTRTYRLQHYQTKAHRWFEEKVTPFYDESGELKSYYGSSRDVTERIEKDQRLRDSEERYRLISDNIHDMITLRDAHGKGVFVSSSVKNLLGYTVEEYLKTNLFEQLHPEDRARIKTSTFEPNFSSKAKGNVEGRIKRKDGTYIWVDTVTAPVLDENGNVIQVVGSSRDITEKKRLENAIRESEQKYRSIFENALVGIFRASLITSKPLDANDVCIKLFGFDSKEEFILNFSGANYFDENERQNWLGAFIDKQTQSKKIRFRRKDGSIFLGETSARILPEHNIIEGIVIDVTKNHEFEEQLKANLREKELLLKEVHHRVKNNLQVISSLLKLQLSKIQNESLRQPLIDSYERIHAIALIHEKLYLSEDVSTINFSEYLTNLTRTMLSLHNGKDVKLNFEVQNFFTDINTAVPLGLICFEIISNAFKHAFKQEANHSLSVKVQISDGFTEIIIEDTGVGFNTASLESTATLGWKLINNLAKQAKADIQIFSESGHGTRFTIKLKNENSKSKPQMQVSTS